MQIAQITRRNAVRVLKWAVLLILWIRAGLGISPRRRSYWIRKAKPADPKDLV